MQDEPFPCQACLMLVEYAALQEEVDRLMEERLLIIADVAGELAQKIGENIALQAVADTLQEEVTALQAQLDARTEPRP